VEADTFANQIDYWKDGLCNIPLWIVDYLASNLKIMSTWDAIVPGMAVIGTDIIDAVPIKQLLQVYLLPLNVR
jgi:hypothetical protein